MHLIQRIKTWHELRCLKRGAKEQPSPSTFVELGWAYSHLDLHAKAQSVARDGLALFPNSSELRQLLDGSRRGSRHRRVADVRAGLARVAELDMVEKVTFMRGSKAMVKGPIDDARDPFLRLVRVTAKAAHGFARRLDFGKASQTVVEGAFGRVCICVSGETLAAAQCSEGCDVESVFCELQEIVVGVLHAAED